MDYSEDLEILKRQTQQQVSYITNKILTLIISSMNDKESEFNNNLSKEIEEFKMKKENDAQSFLDFSEQIYQRLMNFIKFSDNLKLFFFSDNVFENNNKSKNQEFKISEQVDRKIDQNNLRKRSIKNINLKIDLFGEIQNNSQNGFLAVNKGKLKVNKYFQNDEEHECLWVEGLGYDCPEVECPKFYQRKSDLLKHLNNVHGRVPKWKRKLKDYQDE